MNSYTGHLVSDIERLKELFPEQEKFYDPVPKKLFAAAMQELQGKEEAYVDLSKKSPLSDFAKKRRKVRNKIAKASKRRNRK